jgi:hypothetical protein
VRHCACTVFITDYVAGMRKANNRSIQTSAQQPVSIHFSSRSEEWYTPTNVLERVIATLGVIDLDPCSNSRRRPNVPARVHYTKALNGLNRPWFGKVFMNPPYGRDVKKWVAHLCNEFDAGRVQEAIALLHSRTDTVWFSLLRDHSFCFVRGRLRFRGHGNNSAPFPSVLIYLGNKPERFGSAFSSIGDVYRRANLTPAADFPSVVN